LIFLVPTKCLATPAGEFQEKRRPVLPLPVPLAEANFPERGWSSPAEPCGPTSPLKFSTVLSLS
jgi:hypothetical protein